MRILEMAKSGMTDAQIAAKCSIALSTLSNWKSKHPDFLDALKDAKDVANQLVEAALFQRAVGYSQPGVKFFFDAKNGTVVSQKYRERFPPDTTACIFWLKNRDRERWLERHGEDDDTKGVTFNLNYNLDAPATKKGDV